MRIILTADIHLGIPNRFEDSLWALRAIERYGIENEIQQVIILGDLFHDRVNLNIEVLSRTHDFFLNTPLIWTVFCGNHDLFLRNSWSINPLKPFKHLLTVIEDIKLIKIGDQRFWVIPFIHHEAVFMKVLKRIEDTKYQKGDILLTHIGVNNATLNECFLVKNWNFVEFTNSKFDRVYTGHFHCHQQVGDNVWYPGSPIPFDFTEGVVEHGFFVFETKQRKHEFVPIFDLNYVFDDVTQPPDFLTITDDMIQNDLNINNNKIRVHLSREYSYSDRMRIKNKLIERGAISVNWMKTKAPDIVLQDSQSTIQNKDPYQFFRQWVEYDKPKKINHKLLYELHDLIYDEAKELAIVEYD